jgi:N-acyl-phosphatidylethanolamine-hydrolysing phospholipase D
MERLGCPKIRGRYVNPHIKKTKKTFIDFIFWKLGYYKEHIGWEEVPADFVYPAPDETVDQKKPLATWISHNTFLISVDGIHVLTDPVFSNRCSPFSFFGPKRRHAPGLDLHELPQIDYVIISHNHYDHLDRHTVKALHRRFPEITWVVPTGVKNWFARRKIKKVIELSWWEKRETRSERRPNVKLTFTAVPAQHFSGRHLFNIDRTLWAGFVVEFDRPGKELKKMYYVGDTGYNPHDFKAIGNHFGSIDLSLIPIGTYVPRVFMSPVHIEPTHSVEIHKDTRSKLSVSMHWKTFNLSDEPFNQPPYDLFLALKKENIDPHTFRVLEPGYEINW